jgi:hypothetical protein
MDTTDLPVVRATSITPFSKLGSAKGGDDIPWLSAGEKMFSRMAKERPNTIPITRVKPKNAIRLLIPMPPPKTAKVIF